MNQSLTGTAADCLSLTPPFSVVRDVFGYIFGAPSRTLSLRRQLELIRGLTLDVNVIIVAPGGFSADDFSNTQYAIQYSRDVYAPFGLGIRKLNWQQIADDQAGVYAVIDSGSEAHDLTDDWNGPEGALDLFVVRQMNGAYGWSDVEGPCSKDDKDEMTGSVVSLNCCGSCPAGVRCEDDIGTTFAHEMSHYLGLKHDDSTSNLMGDSTGSVTAGTTALTTSQATDMKDHCLVEDRC
jgi:hypothetical protein